MSFQELMKRGDEKGVLWESMVVMELWSFVAVQWNEKNMLSINIF